MKLFSFQAIIVIGVAYLIISCKNETIKSDDTSTLPIEGTWQLLSETKIENGDTTHTPNNAEQKMIKVINKTHFAFLRHDLKQGKDSTGAVFVAGGGPYTLKDGRYKEVLEYCNYREWENHSFDFQILFKGDTLVQQGTEKVEGLGVDRIIIEKYLRVPNNDI